MYPTSLLSFLCFCFSIPPARFFKSLLNYSHFPQATCSFNTCWDGAGEPAVPSCRSLLLHRKHLLFTQHMSWSQTRWKMSREVIRTTFGWESMARKSENGSHWGEEKVESKHSLPRLLLFLLVFSFCVCSSSLLICFLLSQPLILPLSIYFLRWRAKQKMKAALVSSHILSSRPPIFSSTSKVPEQEGLCVMCARVCVDFAIASLNLLMYVCWLLVPTIILFLYLIRL